MKTRLLPHTCLLLIIFVSGGIKAQNWREFAPLGAEWYYSATEFGENPEEGEYVKFWVSKDTLVDGKNCRLIENDSEKLTALDNGNYSSVPVPPYIVYVENDKVFNWYNNKFYLVFDFGVSLGDTVTLHVLPAWVEKENEHHPLPDTMYPFIGIVTSVNGDPYSSYIDYKITHLDEIAANIEFPFSNIYYSRIGTSSHYIIPMTSPMGTKAPFYTQKFRCYHDDWTTVFMNKWIGKCDWRVNINSLNPEELKVNIYPNPANDFINIEFTEDIPITNTVISVENVWGKNYLKQKITGKQTRLDISMLPAGIYLLRIQTANNQFKIAKIVKL